MTPLETTLFKTANDPHDHDRTFAAATLLEHWDRQTRNHIIRVTVLGTFCILIAALVLFSGCAHARGVTAGETRDSAAQARASVEVHTSCAHAKEGKLERGSGVMLDADTVLTAAHVVECWDEHEAIDRTAKVTITVDLLDGEHRIATIAESDHRHDLARLHLQEPVDLYIAPPEIAEPREGDHVCMVTAIPTRRWQCSDIIEVKSRTDNQGEIRHNGEVHPGNSGSPNYDLQGRLLGITTRLIPCTPADLAYPNPKTCGGRLARVYGRAIAVHR